MNDILQLKGPFEQRSSNMKPGAPNLPKGANVSSTHLHKIKTDLSRMVNFWESQTILKNALVSVYYTKVAAKSNRASGLLTDVGKSASSSIVGAKFSKEGTKHVITHYVSLDALRESISKLEKTIMVGESEFGSTINYSVFNDKTKIEQINFEKYKISKTLFQKVVVDAFFIESFDVEVPVFNQSNRSIISLYKTDTDTQKLLEKFGIRVTVSRIIDDTTVLLDGNDVEILKEKAPYLIAMATSDLTQIPPLDFSSTAEVEIKQISNPTNEPVIGVIDTLFDENVYFSSWVEFHNMIDPNIPIEPEDYNHGTAVSFIIVDGPSLNPKLDDGCGKFRVRHFGVATRKAFSSFSIIKMIKQIILQNRDIKVWNLSLGSCEEINTNFISAEAATLDQIQFEYDVIFVIAGTNKLTYEEEKSIGSPADSINSLVVNSVGFDKRPAGYSRKGPVLSFFTKPDIGYYGGSKDDYIKVCEPLGKAHVSGTSFAAPWIARKLAYLIYILGFSREIAKAMIIDSAYGWDSCKKFEDVIYTGHGVVPIKIDEIIKSPNDEIKFVIAGISEKYDTFNYNFPVPEYNNEHPFIARATLCYFPKCSRNQGIDYTNTELDIYFGRIDDKDKLKSINNNKQSLNEETGYVYEEQARKLFRKWDNVKHISDVTKAKMKGRKAYRNKLWGMSIKTKERLESKDGVGIRFGVVVTLKEINGLNRIEDFIQLCSFRGWLVNRIKIENKIDIYQTANETINFE